MIHKNFNILLLLCLYTSLSYADIDSQIEAIKNASVEKRFKLMNEFKKNLIKMKEQERINAMQKLTIKSKNEHTKKALDALKQQTKQYIQNHIEQHNIDEDNIVFESTNQEGEENE